MHGAVARTWLERTSATGTTRLDLGEQPLRLGTDGAVLSSATAAVEWLELGGAPPRLLHRGSGTAPRVNMRTVSEIALAHGDRIEWHAIRLVFHSDDPRAGLLELSGSAPQGTELDAVLAARMQAGLLCELGLVDGALARRWQDAVIAGTFDPDAAARELLGGSRAPAGDPRLRERSARLLRDLLMAPLQRGMRGAARRARTQVRSLAALLVSQFLIVGSLVALILVAVAVARLRWGLSLDAWLDRVLALVP